MLTCENGVYHFCLVSAVDILCVSEFVFELFKIQSEVLRAGVTLVLR